MTFEREASTPQVGFRILSTYISGSKGGERRTLCKFSYHQGKNYIYSGDNRNF